MLAARVALWHLGANCGPPCHSCSRHRSCCRELRGVQFNSECAASSICIVQSSCARRNHGFSYRSIDWCIQGPLPSPWGTYLCPCYSIRGRVVAHQRFGTCRCDRVCPIDLSLCSKDDASRPTCAKFPSKCLRLYWSTCWHFQSLSLYSFTLRSWSVQTFYRIPYHSWSTPLQSSWIGRQVPRETISDLDSSQGMSESLHHSYLLNASGVKDSWANWPTRCRTQRSVLAPTGCSNAHVCPKFVALASPWSHL